MEFSKITVSKEEQELYYKQAKLPDDIQNYFDDLQVLGRQEITAILKWRSRVKHILHKQQQKTNPEDKAENEMEEEKFKNVEEEEKEEIIEDENIDE